MADQKHLRGKMSRITQRVSNLSDQLFAENREPTKEEQTELAELQGQFDSLEKLLAMSKEPTPERGLSEMPIGEQHDGYGMSSIRDFSRDASAEGVQQFVSHGGQTGLIFAQDSDPVSYFKARNKTASFGEICRAYVLGVNNSTPIDVRNIMESVTPSAGGATVAIDFAPEILGYLRANSMLTVLGSRVITIDEGSYQWPRIITDVTPETKVEGASFSEQEFQFDSIAIDPKTVGCVISASRELWADGISFPSTMAREVGAAMAQQIDAWAFTGDAVGSNLNGLLNNGSIPQQPVTGGVTWDMIADAAQTIREANVNSQLGVALSPANYRALMDSKDSELRWLNEAPSIAGTTYAPSSAMPDDKICVGAFGEFHLTGLRQNLLIETTTTGGDNWLRHSTSLKCSARIDYHTARDEAFVVITGVGSA